MALHEALVLNLNDVSLTKFYYMARAILVKNEVLYDRYDIAFLDTFKDVETTDELLEQILEGLKKVKELHQAGWRQAIGSSAPRKNIELLTEVAGIAPYLSGIIAMEDTDRGKPDPEVFLKEAGKIEVLPGWCVVVEDAVFGVQAAKAGYFPCIGVRGGGHSTAEGLREAGADLVVEHLTEVSYLQMARLVR